MKYLNFLIIFLLLLFSCKSEKDNLEVTPKKDNDVKEVRINGIFNDPDANDLNNIVFAEKLQDHIDLFLLSEKNNIKSYVVGEVSIFSADKNMNLISSMKTWSSSSGVPFIESEKFLALGFFNQETYLAEVIIFNKSNGDLSSVNLDVKFIGFLGIKNDFLYIYKEQSNDSISKINLNNGNIDNYAGYYGRVELFIKDENFFLYDYTANSAFQILDDEIRKISDDTRDFTPAEDFSFSSLLVDPRYSLVELKKPDSSTISP